MPRGLFITGTGTGVGKTYVAALIARSLVAAGKRVGVYKPVASGCELRNGQLHSPDAAALWEAAGKPASLAQVCPQLFSAPLAPHLSARAEGRRVDAEVLRGGLEFWRATSEIVLIEGAGGLMSPISDDDYNADLAKEFGYPLIIVAANQLGTINATLQTLITAKNSHDGLPVAGVVLNSPILADDDPSTASNRDELASRCDASLLTEVKYGGGFDREVDWWQLAAK
jgi:dethiobiotin synthetase